MIEKQLHLIAIPITPPECGTWWHHYPDFTGKSKGNILRTGLDLVDGKVMADSKFQVGPLLLLKRSKKVWL